MELEDFKICKNELGQYKIMMKHKKRLICWLNKIFKTTMVDHKWKRAGYTRNIPDLFHSEEKALKNIKRWIIEDRDVWECKSAADIIEELKIYKKVYKI